VGLENDFGNVWTDRELTRDKIGLLMRLISSITFFLGCKHKKSNDFQSEVADPSQGVSPDTLDLIYDGPPGFTLVYFPRDIIQSAHIRNCEVIDKDSTSEMVTRKIWFDCNGNIIKDENNYFQYWFKGTVTGTYTHYYDSSNNLLKVVGIPDKDADSTMTINNYTKNGLLYSSEQYKFARRLKPGADGHLSQPSDYEKYPTWNKRESYKFSYQSYTLIIETIFEGKITEKEKYVLQFDSLNRLCATTKYSNNLFEEVTNYIYESNYVIGNLRRVMSGGEEFKYNSKSVISDKGNQMEMILFNDDGSVDVRMVTTYNADGTISSINYNNNIQVFKYYYY
jgi:hypothetical protein